MALKTVHVSDVPYLDQVPENSALAVSSALFPNGPDGVRKPFKPQKFMVIGHRGSGMNSTDSRLNVIKENSILSFNEAGKSGAEFVEFDVQVTRDDYPIIFHDDFILAEKNGSISERRATELTLKEFLHYGPQREPGNEGKSLLRKGKDGKICNWKVEQDDSLCTLQEAFQRVDPFLGFNVELKFDDNISYSDEELAHTLRVILQVVFKYANERPVIFSSFQPDAARLMRNLQSLYPVFFLTDGGSKVYSDLRRNSLDEAIKHCLMNGLQGIVSEVKAVFRNPGVIPRIKEANLALLTYGRLNNVPEAVYMQQLMGVDSVIIDLVKEITVAVSEFAKPVKGGEENLRVSEAEGLPVQARPRFSQHELSFLLKLIPELIKF